MPRQHALPRSTRVALAQPRPPGRTRGVAAMSRRHGRDEPDLTLMRMRGIRTCGAGTRRTCRASDARGSQTCCGDAPGRMPRQAHLQRESGARPQGGRGHRRRHDTQRFARQRPRRRPSRPTTAARVPIPMRRRQARYAPEARQRCGRRVAAAVAAMSRPSGGCDAATRRQRCLIGGGERGIVQRRHVHRPSPR